MSCHEAKAISVESRITTEDEMRFSATGIGLDQGWNWEDRSVNTAVLAAILPALRLMGMNDRSGK